MNTNTAKSNTNITTSGRIFRLALSYAIIFTVISASGPVGAMAYAVFVAIYLGITASIGWDPVNAISVGSKSSQGRRVPASGMARARQRSSGGLAMRH